MNETLPSNAPSQPPLPPEPTRENAVIVEIGGRIGPEPTRYGDWEKDGRCIDF